MSRLAMIALIGILILTVLLDPYTLHYNGSDAILPGPWWQRALGLGSVVLLVLVAALIWRAALEKAGGVLCAETLMSLGFSVVLIQRDGLARFQMGFGAEENLSWYLAALGLRVLLLYWITLRSSGKSREA